MWSSDQCWTMRCPCQAVTLLGRSRPARDARESGTPFLIPPRPLYILSTTNSPDHTTADVSLPSVKARLLTISSMPFGKNLRDLSSTAPAGFGQEAVGRCTKRPWVDTEACSGLPGQKWSRSVYRPPGRITNGPASEDGEALDPDV
jgi:hypothetical protein